MLRFNFITVKSGSLGIAVIKPFWYTDFADSMEKEQIFKGFSVNSAFPRVVRVQESRQLLKTPE